MLTFDQCRALRDAEFPQSPARGHASLDGVPVRRPDAGEVLAEIFERHAGAVTMAATPYAVALTWGDFGVPLGVKATGENLDDALVALWCNLHKEVNGGRS